MRRDFALVHGFDLLEDGKIDPILESRLDHFLNIVREGLEFRCVIVASKNGRRDKNFVEKTGKTQAATMRDYLIKRGFSDIDKIFLEQEGTNTWLCTVNAYNEIIAPRNYESGMVISSVEHLSRVIAQTQQVFPSQLLDRTSFEGPVISNQKRRGEIIDSELATIHYTLQELKDYAAKLRDK